MNEYKDLKPGLYLQVGTSIKSISQVNGDIWERLINGDTGVKPSLERLAASVGWVFTALTIRGTKLTQIPHEWRFNSEPMEDGPHKMLHRKLLKQTDMSMQMYSCAYWYKERLSGGKINIRWMDPVSIEPDQCSIDEWGNYTRYTRSLNNGKRQILPAEDVIHFMLPGLREIEPGPNASMATRLAAEVLQGSMTATTSLFGNNALPVYLVHVPMGTSSEQRESLTERFLMLFNSKSYGSYENRVAAVADGVTVTKLSMSPSELALDILEDSKRQEIVAAHGVPESIALSNAANYAVSEADEVRFIGTMHDRYLDIAEVLKHDPDFEGWELVPQPKKLDAMQASNLALITVLVEATGGPIMSRDEARDFVELEPRGGEFDEILTPQPTMPAFGMSEPAADNTDNVDDQPVKSALWLADARSLGNWLKKRDNPDIDEFNSNELSRKDKLDIYAKHMTVQYDHNISSEDYP